MNLTALESLFPPLMGLDIAALRSSCSSPPKNSCEGFDSGYGIFSFEEITTALEELVTRSALAITAVDDEAVRNELDCMPALAT